MRSLSRVTFVTFELIFFGFLAGAVCGLLVLAPTFFQMSAWSAFDSQRPRLDA